MSTFSTLLGVGAIFIGAIFILPKVFADKETPAEREARVEQEKKEQALRNKKGALGNTVDFIFGEGTTLNLQTSEERQKVLAAKEHSDAIKLKAANVLGVTVAEYEKMTDPNNDLTKFNPPNVVGYGVATLNNGKGVSVNSLEGQNIIAVEQNRKLKLKATRGNNIFFQRLNSLGVKV